MSPEDQPGTHGEGAPIEEMPVEETRRAASLTLRHADARAERAATMELANRSLADALRIVYRLLQGLMLVLVALFIASGFQQVNESEAGIKVRFGRIVDETVSPGFVPSLPYPLGEIIKVDTGRETLNINRAFWPDVGSGRINQPLTEGRSRFEIGRDGSMLTADGNIVHTQWSISYRRSEPSTYYSSLYVTEDDASVETELIHSALQRAAVHVISTTTIDELIKGVFDQDATTGATVSGYSIIEHRVRDLTQDLLDSVDSGITVESVSLKQKSPPAATIARFREVNQAVSQASQSIEEATSQLTSTYNEVAGRAAEPLLALIDEYGEHLDAGRIEEAEQTFDTIARVFKGEFEEGSLTVAGTTYENIAVGGEAAQTITQGRSLRDTVVAQSERRARLFEAQLANYRANPIVFLSEQRTRALRSMLSSELVQIYLLPEGTRSVEHILNPDPEIRKRMRNAQEQRRILEDPDWARGMYSEIGDRGSLNIPDEGEEN